MGWVVDSPQYLALSDENVAIKGTINGVERQIPISTDNEIYVHLMAEVEAGNITIAPADPDPS